ncbi:MAG: VOC family protein [Acidobacteriota bacterium]
MPAKPIPEGHNAVSPYLVTRPAAKVIEFLKQTFDAQVLFVMNTPNGDVGHAEVKIADSIVMLSDGSPEHPPAATCIHVYVADVDATYRRAIAAGGAPVREPADQFYGDRSGGVKDAGGNQWWISTHKEDLTSEELERRAKAAGRA